MKAELKQKKLVLDTFLKANRCYTTYYRSLTIDIASVLECAYDAPLNAGFVWADSSKGADYWFALSEKWATYYKSLTSFVNA